MCLTVAAPKADPDKPVWLCDTGKFVSCDAAVRYWNSVSLGWHWLIFCVSLLAVRKCRLGNLVGFVEICLVLKYSHLFPGTSDFSSYVVSQYHVCKCVAAEKVADRLIKNTDKGAVL